MSDLFRLGKSDFVKGLIVAILSAVFLSAGKMLQAPDFDFTAINWHEILNVAGATFMAYIGKNWLSDKEGRVLGRIG